MIGFFETQRISIAFAMSMQGAKLFEMDPDGHTVAAYGPSLTLSRYIRTSCLSEARSPDTRVCPEVQLLKGVKFSMN